MSINWSGGHLGQRGITQIGHLVVQHRTQRRMSVPDSLKHEFLTTNF